jgi:hypothetical protein
VERSKLIGSHQDLIDRYADCLVLRGGSREELIAITKLAVICRCEPWFIESAAWWACHYAGNQEDEEMTNWLSDMQIRYERILI